MNGSQHDLTGNMYGRVNGTTGNSTLVGATHLGSNSTTNNSELETKREDVELTISTSLRYNCSSNPSSSTGCPFVAVSSCCKYRVWGDTRIIS